ncbi:hypothetical protein VTH82DRAFT_4745 [Thermothelomyces myriococcoides]
MGSNDLAFPSSFPLDSLPDANSPLLILTHPTRAERVATVKHTYHNWGCALTEEEYITREEYLTTVPLARNGGITHWILTVASMPPDGRPILSSCESLRKRALCSRDGEPPVEGIAHAIGSVFTEPAYRGRGYASRMLRELGEKLRGWQVSPPSPTPTSVPAPAPVSPSRALFSVLYSDIGKSFYARHGWPAFESSHVSFRPVAGAAAAAAAADKDKKQVATPIGYHELAELCAVDEKLLREDLMRRRDGKTHVAILPELDAMLWHLMREDFMTKSIFGKTPTVRGAVAGKPGQRIWAVWMRGYYGGLKKKEGNIFHVLRVVVEDPNQPDEELLDGFRSIVQIAQHEAAEWHTQDIQIWNPTPKLKGLVEKCGIESQFVVREMDSIPSLRWHGEEPTSEVVWVANEKYAWC